MTHPIVKRFLAGKNDAGGTIHALELEIERLQKRLAELEAAQQSVQADTKACEQTFHQLMKLQGKLFCSDCGVRL